MDYRNHIEVGILSELFVIAIFLVLYAWKGLFQPILSIESVIIYLFIIIISSLLPDIDHAISIITKWFLNIGLGIGVISLIIDNKDLIVFSILFSFLVHIISRYSKHRGFIHSIIACLLYGLIILYYTSYVPIAIISIVGYYSHLYLDKIPFKIK